MLPYIAARKDGRPVEEQVADVVKAYLEAAAWTEELPGNKFSNEARHLATFEVTAFLHLAKWHTQGWTLEQLGHDFWLTRNGHGTGFFDRETGTEESRDALTTLSKVFGDCDCYAGDDGLLYF